MKTIDILLHTKHPITPDEMSELADLGLRIVTAVDETTYRLSGTTDATEADLLALDFVDEVQEVKPVQKLDSTLKQEAVKATLAASAGFAAAAPTSVSVLVSLDKYGDVDATLDALAQMGDVKQSSKRRALVEISANQIEELASLPGVLAAEIEPDVRTQNNVARSLTRANPVADTLGLDGSGEIVGVADSGLDTGVPATILPDFAGRIVNIRATVNKAPLGVADGADLENHGTHVCGSILGNGASSNGNLRGMAFAARLTMLSMGPSNSTSLSVPADLTTGVFQDAYNDNARIHNNSWSTPGSAGAYLAFSDDVDQFIRDNPDMLIVFAAGNDGDGVGTVTSPGTAKNCLTVGAAESVRPLPTTATLSTNPQDHDNNPATPDQNVPLVLSNFDDQADDFDQIAGFSGRGPTDDNRIKPDIVAPGTWILSTRSSLSTADTGIDGLPPISLYPDDADGIATHAEAVGRGLPGAPIFGTWDQNTPDAPPGSGAAYQQNYYYNSGTSMAAPITTGAVALLRQYLRQRRGVANPSAALLKAMLVNGATVPVGQSNDPDNDRGFGWLNLENTLTPAPTGQQSYSDDVNLAVATGDVRSFSVQLADPTHPFRVTLVWADEPGSGVQNKLYLRVIDPGGTIFDGDVTAFPTVRNNVQRVHIETPVAGTYTIEVHGIQVLFGIDAFPGQARQDFALAIINGIGFSPEPVDICQVIDKSGSMGFYGYMTPVKERAKQLVDMLRINDRAGVVAFDGASVPVHAVVPITDPGVQTAIKNDIDLLSAGGVTSIGAGLELGRDELDAGGDPGHPQALVLLSDGHENTPPWVGGGVTDSPPAWYGGPDFSEVLPTLPTATKVYTVSLGVQSDEVLLQDIATQTGGVFHAIHSAAEIGKLHEIYVHLQALTGGEEVIASGSDGVTGLNLPMIASASAAAAAPVAVEAGDRALISDMQGLTNVEGLTIEGGFSRLFNTVNTHKIPVDDTMSTLTAMVSWHEIDAPVSLTLITPSQRTIRPDDSQYFNFRGSSYQFFRIENPEPGMWTLVVRSGKRRKGPILKTHAYTWGAYGVSSLGIRYKLPKKLVGSEALELAVKPEAEKKTLRSVRFVGIVHVPRQSTEALLKKYRSQLKEIDLTFKPDTPKIDPNLFKLALLDRQLQEKGKRSIFRTQRRRLRLTRNTDYSDALKLAVPGMQAVQIIMKGRTREGYAYRREVRFDVRT